MGKMENPKLIKEYSNFFSNKWNLRIYYTVEEDSYRFHFGFPEKLVEPISSILECSPIGESNIGQRWMDFGYGGYPIPRKLRNQRKKS